MDFIPKKTGTYEVRSAWGNPVKKSSLDAGLEDWYFDFPGTPLVSFKDQTLDTVTFYLKDCTLEKITAQLGPPEKVEIITLVSCIDLQHLWVTQNLHYPSLGFSYFRLCDETQDCFSFHSNDLVNGKEFYSLDKVIEDSKGFNMSGYVYTWHGFDINVEEVENKIEDFPIGTPTP